ncbi:hypothetical protein [Bacillus tuaregi]|nr:hypothetical protein [Bacillus tuaregi]
MKKDHSEQANQNTPQDSIMNQVNQTFDEMVKDVRNLLTENAQKNNLK